MPPLYPSFSREWDTLRTKAIPSKGWTKNTLLALSMAVPLFVASTLENNAHGEENISTPPAITKKLPSIIESYPQIHTFLDGDILENDTPSVLWEKLAKKIEFYHSMNDNILFEIRSEMLYRKKTGKPQSEALIQGFEQFRKEQVAVGNLLEFFKTLKPESLGKINEAIILCYKQMGGKAWGEKELEEWRKSVEKERKKLNYTYLEAMMWAMQYQKFMEKKEKPIKYI